MNACICFLLAALRVVPVGDTFQVLQGTNVFVRAIRVDRGVPDESDVRTSFVRLADGTEVWNRWSERKDRRFRLEVAQRADGAVEISMSGQMEMDSSFRRRILNLELPRAALGGEPYRMLSSRSRMQRFEPVDGAFDDSFKELRTRFLATCGIVCDFNPTGPGDQYAGYAQNDDPNAEDANAIMGIWTVRRTEDGFVFSGGDEIRRTYGGMSGAKVVLYPGTFDDYDRIHFERKHRYRDVMAARVSLAFGAPKHGASYRSGDKTFDRERGFGWMEDVSRRTVIGHPEGAYYSCVTGEGLAVYRFAGLEDGYYVVNFAAGNYSGASNRFDLSFGYERIATDLTVPTGKVRLLAKAVRVRGGSLDVRLSGRWILSTLAVQPLLSVREDFSFARGFWLTDAYEPSILFRNADTREPVFPSLSDNTIDLPVPGTECNAVPHLPPVPVEKPSEEELPSAWLRRANMVRFLSNTSTLAEFEDPGHLERSLDALLAGRNVQVVMLSGMLSRHAYCGHVERGIRAVGRIAAALHRRGIKLIDHHDATLLWNIVGGYRTLAERLDETIRTRDGSLPTYQLCPSNAEFRRRYFDYLRRLVLVGVDGFQIDELEFWSHGCGCRHCREAFRRDTGWTMPMNECDAAWNDPKSELRRRWQDWRKKAIADWFVALRRSLKDICPGLILSNYITNDWFCMPQPKLTASTEVQELGRVMNYLGSEMMTRSTMINGRQLFPVLRMRRGILPDESAAGWAWFYNFNWQNDYFSWAMSVMTGQLPLLSDIAPTSDMPPYRTFAATPAAMDVGLAEPVASVALLFPSYSRDWNEGADYRPELFGTAQALEALHIPYVFISDDKLAAGAIGNFRVLFLGEAQCLSDAEIVAVRSFAAAGGKVRLSVRAGTRNEFGLNRPKRAFGEDASYLYYAETSRAAPFALEENWQTKRWDFDPDPAAEAAFRREVADWASVPDAWRIDAPDKVFTAVWRERTDVYAVHFLNATGVCMKKGDKVITRPLDPAFPPLVEVITIHAPLAGSWTVEVTSPDFPDVKTYSTSRDSEGDLVVTLPPEILMVYSLVRIRRTVE